MFKKLFLFLLMPSLFLSFTSSLHAQIANPPPFESTLMNYLSEQGLRGDLLDVKKSYDEDGFITYFLLKFQENKLAQKDRSEPEIDIELKSDNVDNYLNFKLLKKDISGISYMYYDWIASIAVRIALHDISDILSLPLDISEDDGVYTAIFSPSTTTEATRYRFDELKVVYTIENLLLNLDVTVKGPQDYLVMEYLKNYLNSAVRTIENGRFPGAIDVLSFDSNFLIRKILKLDEASQKLPGTIPMMQLRVNSTPDP